MKLSLHRSDKQPDWLKVPEVDRNQWQKLALRTSGIVTPGNIITLIGFGVAITGIVMMLASHFWWAIILLTIGRLLDIADGVVADRTGTKSPLGEFLDAAVDKIVTGLTVLGLFIAQTAPCWLLLLFLLPHAIIPIIVFAARAKKIEIHPSRLGKTAMLIVWIAVPLILLVNALGLDWPNIFVGLVYAFTLVSATLGFMTAYSYLPKSARL